jgi:hypothetical protein
MRKSIFVNNNRTSRERRVRYCFIRSCGFNRDTARILSGYSDVHFVKTYEGLQKCVEIGHINADFSPKVHMNI